MLKANSLFLVIILSLGAAVICSSFLLLAYYHKISFLEAQIRRQLILNVESGVNYCLAAETETGSDGVTEVDLFGTGEDIVKVKSGFWGVFKKKSVTAVKGRNVFSKSFLVGHKPAGKTASALFLVDHNRQLSVSGKTLLKGDCYLPQAGIDREYLEGKSFAFRELIQGRKLRSDSKIPDLNKLTIASVNDLLEGQIPSDGIILHELSEADQIHRSFSDSTYIFRLTSHIYLNNSYQGNIIIFSETGITVSGNAMLKDVILVAPYIHLQNNFSGSLQAFARDSILVEENCDLLFPSVLGLLSVSESKRSNIRIQRNSSVAGSVFSCNDSPALHGNDIIILEKNSSVTGVVFAHDKLQLQGRIHGHATCNRFWLKTSKIYENVLVDAEIDYAKLPEEYIGPALFETEKKNRLLKWLN